MNLNLLFALVFCFLLAGCGPASPPEASRPQKPEEPKEARVDRERLRRAHNNIQSYLSDLEGRLRISSAETWSKEAAAAQGDLGNIRIAVGTLRAASQNVVSLESSLADLEGRLRGASAENWNQNASAAQHLVGNIRIELQNLDRDL